MIHSHRKVLEAQIEALPALPATVTKVMAVTANPESTANDLMHIVSTDQTMCSTILKVANSAFFGIPRQVSTIERAVVVLGYEEIRNIVIGKAIFASFPKMTKDKRHTVGLFWEHAFTCGLAAKIIGAHLHLSQSELFVAGLIHDIGKLVMFISFLDQYPLLREISGLNLINNIAEERETFSISHDQVGLQLAERWLLPHQLVAAIGYHHKPQDAPQFKQYPLIVQAADILSFLYCSPDKIQAKDVVRMFNDFLPETGNLWLENQLPWDTDIIGSWFEALQKSRETDQGLLTFFSSP